MRAVCVLCACMVLEAMGTAHDADVVNEHVCVCVCGGRSWLVQRLVVAGARLVRLAGARDPTKGW